MALFGTKKRALFSEKERSFFQKRGLFSAEKSALCFSGGEILYSKNFTFNSLNRNFRFAQITHARERK